MIHIVIAEEQSSAAGCGAALPSFIMRAAYADAHRPGLTRCGLPVRIMQMHDDNSYSRRHVTLGRNASIRLCIMYLCYAITMHSRAATRDREGGRGRRILQIRKCIGARVMDR